MGSHPINLAVRFLLEIAGLVALAMLGWYYGKGVYKYLLASTLPLVAAVCIRGREHIRRRRALSGAVRRQRLGPDGTRDLSPPGLRARGRPQRRGARASGGRSHPR